ncbi:hypothetical protein HYALB_00004389 [Hymenoscyphus albidus]|uniref:Histone transcription regulator 3 homolog n=1 Tax=Hymenoscyphus albidus TaxID=595503 RepID=A0A9N9LKI3_9HELO|nr:hypothetical protein HYALB_00004389 [Hymenoscyphus albidus]
MASFTALNIEPDDHIDDEVDNTKELQIEEALRLYQTALKLHAQGPTAFGEAKVAYENLFRSEIFTYPESITEFQRIELNPELELLDQSFALDLDLGGPDSPSTLPQILYLSYKNHAQFVLDCAKGRRNGAPLTESESLLEKVLLNKQAHSALSFFTLALVSDQSDTELWRRTARVASTLGSRAIARYCLEAAVEADDDPTVAEVDPASLEEGFAGEQLKEVLNVLSDDTALSHPIMAPFRKRKMPSFLNKYLDPYPFLPDPTKTLEEPSPENNDQDGMDKRFVVISPQRSWSSIGNELCQAYLSPLGLSGTGILLSVPEEQAALPEIVAEAVVAVSDTLEGDQIMKDVDTTESPATETNEPPPAVDTSIPESSKSDDAAVVVETTTAIVTVVDEPERQASVGLPTRKRSQSAAGIRDTPDEDSAGGAQKRSKRIRNRNDVEGFVDPATQYAEQLKTFIRADEDVFEYVGNILTKLGVDDLGKFSDLQNALKNEDMSDRAEVVTNTAVRDLRDVLKNWDEAKASTFVNGNAADILGSSAASANAGLAAFLEHSKSGPQKVSTIPLYSELDGLSTFISRVESEWMPLQDVIYEWALSVLQTYRSTLWSEDLKVALVRVISFADSEICIHFQEDMEYAKGVNGDKARLAMLEDIAETLFELHLDIYCRITNPNSIVQHEIRIMTKERLDRWADYAAETIRARNLEPSDDMSVRYLWASVFHSTTADSVSREHKVLCWTEMKALLEEVQKPPMELQNNAVMPEISIDAADREVSRLTTMDFFFNLFQTDRSDPVAIIETLEPVLDPESACLSPEDGENGMATEATDGTPAALREMWKFLKSGSTSLRLFLWQRLRDAYSSIGYNTKVFSCHLKSIEIIVGDLRGDDYVDSADDPRRHKLLTWLKALDDLLVKSLTIALNDASLCFEIVDERHLKSTCFALAQLSRVLHSAAIFDDEVGLGLTVLPQTSAYSPQGSFNGFISKLREMQVRTWSLQYTMVKESMNQCPELYANPENQLADFLALVHYCLGLRKCCKVSNKIFLKMMKVELIRLKNVDKWEDYLGQVLFDLYGIKLGVGTYMLDDHGCPTETLYRRTVLNIADQVIALANGMSMKDLLKHELRPTIEKMQAAVGPAKPSPQMMHNLRNYTEYLRGSIRPLNMYKAFKGQVEVDSLPVTTAESPLANKNWYFLMGMIALTKFRTQKRLGPGAQQDDMKVAASFLRLQLQFSSDHWETWFRLAQCFDAELEEEVMWSADKINNHRADLVKLQRSSIHCYILAISTAYRTADDSLETAAKLSEMYHEFGMRLYASSREPLSMEAFHVDGFEKHMSGSTGMYKNPLHGEMSRYMVWKFAAVLFRKSLADRPTNWMSHYMLGKCLWKMYDKEPGDPARPSMDSVLNAFLKAIKTVPMPRDGRQEPILEPHYKIVSIVHKLVLSQAMELQPAADLLQQQPMALNKGERVEITNDQEWRNFILDTMKNLRSLDKQHWQHRMVARVANILWDVESPDETNAAAVRHEFRESIFTKTMHIQVWKPDAERPGRHCVYMERYVRFMCHMLYVLNDKVNMEQFAKRVKKKSNDFHKFSVVWGEVCHTYLKLIRKNCQIPENMDEVFKNVSSEEFDIISERLTSWIADPSLEHPLLEALRDGVELKKLNGNAMKSAPIDDLINDAWAALYTQIGKSLPGPDPGSLANTQLDGSGEGGVAPRPLGSMSLNNLVMDMNGTQIPVPVTIAGSESSRPRKLGISRREVLRRSEIAVSRMPEVARAPPPPSGRSRLSEPTTILGSNAEVDQPMPDVEESQNGNGGLQTVQESTEHENEEEHEHANEQLQREEQDSNDKEAQAQQTQGTRQASESVRGSVHDSADDESDLSDVPDMDDIDEERLFNPLHRLHQDRDEEGDDDEESEDEEEGSGDDDEPGEDEAEEAEEEEEEDEEEPTLAKLT